jgi:hypothetical protein
MIIVGGMRVSLKAVNDEVARRVVKPVLAKEWRLLLFPRLASQTGLTAFLVENQAR